MSGGSFNYLCHRAEDARIFEDGTLNDMQDMADYLQHNGHEDAAKEIRAFRQRLIYFKDQVVKRGKTLVNVLHACEWWVSNDGNELDFIKAWDEFKKKQRGKR